MQIDAYLSWEIKVLKKGCVRKLVVQWDHFYKRIAGGLRLLVTQMPGKVSKPRKQRLEHLISQPRALKSQGCGKSGVKLWLLSWISNDVHVHLCF